MKWDKNVFFIDVRIDGKVEMLLLMRSEQCGAVPGGRWLPLTAGPQSCLPALDSVLAARAGHMGSTVFPEVRMLKSQPPRRSRMFPYLETGSSKRQ